MRRLLCISIYKSSTILTAIPCKMSLQATLTETPCFGMPLHCLAWSFYLQAGFGRSRDMLIFISVRESRPCVPGAAKLRKVRFICCGLVKEQITDSRVADSQCLILRAVDGSKDFPCLWLRGLLPKELVAINEPFVQDLQVQYVGIHQSSVWPEGTYHTDASGGVHSCFAALRRCGIGIAFLCKSTQS